MKIQNFRGLVRLSCLGLILSGMLMSGCTQSSITASSAGEKAQNYINDHILKSKEASGKLSSKVINVKESGDFYAVNLDLIKDNKSQHKYTVYITKSGNNIILNPDQMYIRDINKSPEEEASAAKEKADEEALKNIPKNDKPNVEVFVMSGCPYGVQIENSLLPLVEHFGDQMSMLDLNLHFIGSKGSGNGCIGEYCSMHGIEEARENARQACLAKEQPDKLWPYLKEFNSTCKVTSKTTKADAEKCSQAAAKKVGVDAGKLQSCYANAKDILSKELALVNEKKAYGSPTVFINGSKYTGSRSSNSLLKAICAGFKSQPKACETMIADGDSVQAASGGCNAGK